jgi:hypothetical protein
MNRLIDGGPDLPEAVAAICPNCHREVQYGADGRSFNKNLQGGIATKEEHLLHATACKVMMDRSASDVEKEMADLKRRSSG